MIPSVVQVSGTYNAQGTNPNLYFYYGTDPTMTIYNVIPATPGSTSGYANTNATAVLTNLTQNTTYYYQLAGSSQFGSATSPINSFTTQLLSGFLRQFPSQPPAYNASLQVNLTPTTINPSPGWNFVGELLWRPSGSTVSGLVAGGSYNIEYQSAPGYIQPAPEAISVTGGQTTQISREYYPTPGGVTGGLTVVFNPTGLAGAQWQIVGQSQWNNSGDVVTGLNPGNYLVTCSTVNGYITPLTASVTVPSGTTPQVTLTYLTATTPSGAQPVVLPSFSNVIDPTTPALPYAFVGQIRSDVGTSSGFVVENNVVATAGHVVFDDGSLSYVTGLQWLFQRYSGTYEPIPQIPQGFYVMDGYAAQRMAEATPGVSSETSQNLDAAALYFSAPAGNGGYSGYLASDSSPNEFLTSSNSKMLVGYPVNGITSSEQGQMFVTGPVTASFSQDLGYDDSTNPNTSGTQVQVYTTSGLTSVGGNSGGPLWCVQYSDGNYYPAAIYLGGTAEQTSVRAIDSNVIALFYSAEVSGSGGSNNTGGGITQVNTTISASGLSTAQLQVNFQPAAASGATWAIGTESFTNGYTLKNITVGGGPYELVVSPVTGFLPPPAYFPITLTANILNTTTVTYEGITSQPQAASAVVGGSATFSVAVSQVTPATYQWMRNGVNIQGATSATYTRSNVSSADNGSSYSVLVTWGTDGKQTSTPATLAVSGSAATYSSWAAQEGLSGASALSTAIISHDGLNNLYKYALGLNPFTLYNPGNASLPVVQLANVSGTEYLTLSFDGVATDVTYKVQATSDFNAGWTTIKTYGSGGAAPGIVTVQDTQPITASSKRYMRLYMTNP